MASCFGNSNSVAAALKQIEKNGYAIPYKKSGKKIIKLGVKFCSKKKNIADWKASRGG
ncbi:MAG: PD-(D/E)XK nuclease domain-containing protein [Fibromonadales bacterium]|nr:PD-(D/E)XK nuclease domain-containing protein [Fibromonadales bacterium]